MERYFYRHPILLYNDWSKHKVLENPNWQGADQLVIYTAQLRSWTRGDREQIQEMVVRGLEPRTTIFQVQHPNQSVTPSNLSVSHCQMFQRMTYLVPPMKQPREVKHLQVPAFRRKVV